MPAALPTLDSITPSHLEAMVANGAAESITLEFKSAPYPAGQDGGREFLKDICALANTSGGWLLIGIAEEGGAASEIVPIDDGDPDKMQQRLESLLQSGIEPRVSGTRMRKIDVTGGYVIVIRIPPSANVPHRVTAQNSNRYYLRSSAGAYEASYGELKSMFSQTAGFAEQFRRFRNDRVEAIGRRITPIPIVEDRGRLVVHIKPVQAFGGHMPINIKDAESHSLALRPIKAGSFSGTFNLDGYLSYRGGSDCHGYTQLYRDGTVEAVHVSVWTEYNGHNILIAAKVQDALLEEVPRYLDVLQELEVAPPLMISASVERTSGLMVVTRNIDWNFDKPPIVHDPVMHLTPVILEDYEPSAGYGAVFKPALDALWNAGGLPEWTPAE